MKFEPGLMYGEGRSEAKDDAQAVRGNRLVANPDGGKADEIKVSTVRATDGETIQVVVAFVLPINRDVVWEVLNDYGNMPRFVPDILATRLISTGAGESVWRSKG